MDATAMLVRLENLGVSLTIDGDDVVARPGNRVPRELIPEMKACKPQLVELLAPPDADLCRCDQWEGPCKTGLLCLSCFTPSRCSRCNGCRRCWLVKFCKSLIGRARG